MVSAFNQLFHLDNPVHAVHFFTVFRAADGGCIGNQNQAVQRGFHAEAQAGGQVDFAAVEQALQQQDVAVVLLDGRFDGIGFALGIAVKFAVLVEADAFGKTLAFAHIDFQKTVDEQVVDLRGVAFKFQAQVVYNCPSWAVFVMEVDLECGIGFAFDAGLDVADFLPDLLLGIGIDMRQGKQGVEFVKVALAAVGFFNQHGSGFLSGKRTNRAGFSDGLKNRPAFGRGGLYPFFIKYLARLQYRFAGKLL